ncbi:general secretion pathway protein GspK, partial [Psychrobacter sp. 16-Bac2893]
DSNALAVLQRLLTQLNLAPDIAIAVLDYQDADSEVYQDGGDESTVYNQQSNSSADNDLPNQRLVNIDQLQNVKGINAEVLAVLRPYITVVPHYLPINMNTASPVLLAALMDGATSQQMQTIVDLREKQVFESIDEIWQLPILSSLDNKQRKVLAPLLAVDSQAFTALITATDNATVGQARQRYATIMISKTATDVTENSNNGDNANSNNKNADNKKPKEVRVVTQRLWAFRPNF